TGALDTETSVQVMEILKKISEDKLIIMVTHNPELADKYASRIIRVLDGEITGDSMPLSDEEITSEKAHDEELRAAEGKKKKPSMSFGTAFSLSLKNLMTKKGRTILTSFAGSIGIIGISLILALSQGVTDYINDVQEESLSAYPLTIESSVMDFSSLFETFSGQSSKSEEHGKDAIYTKPIFSDLVNAMSASNQTTNDLTSFKEYIETERADEDSELHDAISTVKYSYALDLGIYTKNADGDIIYADPNSLMQDIMQESMGIDVGAMMEQRDNYMAGMSSMFSTGVSLSTEMLPSKEGGGINDIVKNQYDLVYGDWAEDYNEVMLVLDENNEIDDLSLYALGLKSHDDMKAMMDAALNQEEVEYDDRSWSYEDVCGKEYKLVLNPDCYSKDSETGNYNDLRDSETGLKYLYDNGIDLKISGIIRPNEDATAAMIQTAIAYTDKLTKYVIEQSEGADPIQAQLDSHDTDIFNCLPFEDETADYTDAQKAEAFKDYADTLEDTRKS
ncbi:MAG: ABC transporter, partial [Ruminococcus sp.]|nr:ABC transporter [Ruminococcus sp.]